MNRQQILDFYSRKEILDELVKNSAEREIAGRFLDGSYDQRPNVIQYPSDIIQMVQKGITSFHYSVEKWKNPMAIATDNYDDLRSGWDLLIDIDSKVTIDEAKVTAIKICEFFEKYGIKNYGLKFSGSRGFHVCLTSKMFPKEMNNIPIEKMYPDAPRALAEFISEKIKDDLMKEMLKQKPAKELIEAIGEQPSELSPYLFVEIEKGWGNRHMFRAPYSFNEKTWLVSVPLTLDELKKFNTGMAKPEAVKVKEFFKGEENEAEGLLLDALDWKTMNEKEVVKKKKPMKIKSYDKKISEEYFPPCVKLILKGVQDGKKRSVFTVINFLRLMNWNWKDIRDKLHEWNTKNTPPLPENFILGQLNWSMNNLRNPANCPPEGDQYYISTGFCQPDSYCKGFTNKITIKNPISYPFKVMRRENKMKKKTPYAANIFSCRGCDRKFPKLNSLKIHGSRMHGFS